MRQPPPSAAHSVQPMGAVGLLTENSVEAIKLQETRSDPEYPLGLE